MKRARGGDDEPLISAEYFRPFPKSGLLDSPDAHTSFLARKSTLTATIVTPDITENVTKISVNR